MTDTLPISKIKPSSTNPRKTFDTKDLVASVKREGVLDPLIVRPKGKGFEVVTGERRYRSAKEAGLTEVPVQIREMTDEDAQRIQVVENLQRENVPALEEADGFEALMTTFGWSARKLAETLGKPRRYIAERSHLAHLRGPARDALSSGKIAEGHAIVLSRLDEEAQEYMLGRQLEHGWTVDGLKQQIQTEVEHSLEGVPWSLEVEYAEMRACAGCPGRTKSQPDLFDRQARDRDTCFVPRCWTAKMDHAIDSLVDTGIQRVSETKRRSTTKTLGTDDWAEAEGHPTKYHESGVIVDGPRIGQQIWIVTDRDLLAGRMETDEAELSKMKAAADSAIEWVASEKELSPLGLALLIRVMERSKKRDRVHALSLAELGEEDEWDGVKAVQLAAAILFLTS